MKSVLKVFCLHMGGILNCVTKTESVLKNKYSMSVLTLAVNLKPVCVTLCFPPTPDIVTYVLVLKHKCQFSQIPDTLSDSIGVKNEGD